MLFSNSSSFHKSIHLFIYLFIHSFPLSFCFSIPSFLLSSPSNFLFYFLIHFLNCLFTLFLLVLLFLFASFLSATFACSTDGSRTRSWKQVIFKCFDNVKFVVYIDTNIALTFPLGTTRNLREGFVQESSIFWTFFQIICCWTPQLWPSQVQLIQVILPSDIISLPDRLQKTFWLSRCPCVWWVVGPIFWERKIHISTEGTRLRVERLGHILTEKKKAFQQIIKLNAGLEENRNSSKFRVLGEGEGGGDGIRNPSRPPPPPPSELWGFFITCLIYRIACYNKMWHI